MLAEGTQTSPLIWLGSVVLSVRNRTSARRETFRAHGHWSCGELNGTTIAASGYRGLANSTLTSLPR